MERDDTPRRPLGAPFSPPPTKAKASSSKAPITPPGQVIERAETPPTELAPGVEARFEGDQRSYRLARDTKSGDRPAFSSDEELPDRPDEDPESDESDTSDDSSEDESMAELIFEGKVETLEDILTHCNVTYLSKPRKFPDDATKSGYLAAQFRGKALTWLTAELKSNPNLLKNHDEFTKAVRRAFEPSKEAQRIAADKKLKTLTQRGSAQTFLIEFEYLTGILGYEDGAKRQALMTRVKPEVRKQLVGLSYDDYADLKASVVRYDEELFALRNPRPRRTKGQGKGPPKPDKN